MSEIDNKIKYLPIWPTGEDLTGLKPQKTISNAIAQHIVDYDDEHYEGGAMPRVIGLEGKWGITCIPTWNQLY